MKLIKAYKKFEGWFDYKFGWFFTNGNKMEFRERELHKKFKLNTKNNVSRNN